MVRLDAFLKTLLILLKFVSSNYYQLVGNTLTDPGKGTLEAI